jgi:hypothetical protein
MCMAFCVCHIWFLWRYKDDVEVPRISAGLEYKEGIYCVLDI